MSDPTNPNGGWQQVPSTPVDPTVPPASAAGYPPPPNYPPQQPPPGYGPPAAAGVTSNTAAAISYLTFIPAIIFLVMEPYKRDPFIRFHAIQSIALNVVGFAIGLVFAALSFSMYTMGMGMMVSLIHGVINLLLFVAWLMAIINAAQGKWFKLPVIGDFSLKQSRSL